MYNNYYSLHDVQQRSLVLSFFHLTVAAPRRTYWRQTLEKFCARTVYTRRNLLRRDTRVLSRHVSHGMCTYYICCGRHEDHRRDSSNICFFFFFSFKETAPVSEGNPREEEAPPVVGSLRDGTWYRKGKKYKLRRYCRRNTVSLSHDGASYEVYARYRFFCIHARLNGMYIAPAEYVYRCTRRRACPGWH